MIRSLRAAERERALMALQSIFASVDPFEGDFTSSVESKLLLYPTEGYMLTSAQFDAIRFAAVQRGAPLAFLSITELIPDLSFDSIDTWQLDLNDVSYSDYRGLRDSGPVVLENAIYSADGLWGVSISQDFHAIVGGSDGFIHAFSNAAPDELNGVEGFLQAWRRNRDDIGSDLSWIAPLFVRLYGEKRARQYLEAADLSELM